MIRLMTLALLVLLFFPGIAVKAASAVGLAGLHATLQEFVVSGLPLETLCKTPAVEVGQAEEKISDTEYLKTTPRKELPEGKAEPSNGRLHAKRSRRGGVCQQADPIKRERCLFDQISRISDRLNGS